MKTTQLRWGGTASRHTGIIIWYACECIVAFDVTCQLYESDLYDLVRGGGRRLEEVEEFGGGARSASLAGVLAG